MGEIAVDPSFQWPKRTNWRRRNIASAVVWVLYLDGPIQSNYAVEDLQERLARHGTRVDIKTLRALVKDLAKREKMGKMIARVTSGTWTTGLSLDPDVTRLPPCPFDRVTSSSAETAETAETDNDDDVVADELDAGAGYQPLLAPDRWQLRPPGIEERDEPTRQAEDLGPHGDGDEREAVPALAPAPVVAEDVADLPATAWPLNGSSPEPAPFVLPPDLARETSYLDKLLMASALMTAAMIQGPPRPETAVVEEPSPAPAVDQEVLERLATALEDAQRWRMKWREASDVVAAEREEKVGMRRMMAQMDANMQAVLGQQAVDDSGFRRVERFIQERPHAKR